MTAGSGLPWIIGKMAKKVVYRNAISWQVIPSGLNIKLRGVEDRSLHRDTYAVLGPWLTTPEEIHDPDNLNIRLQN